MIGYLVRRLLGAIPLLLGILTLIFFVMHLAPGDPTDRIFSNPNVSPEVTRLLQEAERQPTEQLANPLWIAAAERIVQDQPYTWLYYYDPVTARSPRLRGVEVDTYGAYQNTWVWWLADAPGRGGADSAGSQTKG